MTILKQYKITDNGFLWIFENGERVAVHFYHKGHEKYWEKEGYTKIRNLLWHESNAHS